ncbi:MAG: hypothetical protein M0006_14235 [Magnetospirillum sp.]|nr:hypothetical protein [Magnetospirillum sp.]
MPLNPKEKEAIKFLLVHLSYGIVGAITFGVALLAINLSNIRTLAFDSAHPVLIVVLLFFGLLVTFGGISMAVGVMSLARDDEREMD